MKINILRYSDTLRKQLTLRLLTVLLVMLVGAGCTTSPSTQLSESHNNGFMSLWNTYADCKSTSDLAQAESDLKRLRTAGEQGSPEHEAFVLPLPSRFERLVSNPASRAAVDVQAMISACALHAGEIALDLGHVDIARDFFVSVITFHKEENSYYVIRAKTLLSKLGHGVNLSFNTQ